MKNGLEIDEYGTKLWLKNNVCHRVNGPVEICIEAERRSWSINGYLHRLDGPTIIYGINKKYYYWYINHIDITDDLNQYCSSHNINIDDYKNLKFSDKLKLKFKFGLSL